MQIISVTGPGGEVPDYKLLTSISTESPTKMCVNSQQNSPYWPKYANILRSPKSTPPPVLTVPTNMSYGQKFTTPGPNAITTTTFT